MTQHRVLDLERGSGTAAGDESGKSSNEQVHQEEDHAAPILRTRTEAQIRVSDPYGSLARPDGTHYSPEAAPAVALAVVTRTLVAAGLPRTTPARRVG